MKNKILSLLMISILSLILVTGLNSIEVVEASTYGTKVKSIELVNYYGTSTDHNDSDVLYGTSNYIGDDTSVEGVYEYGLGKNLVRENWKVGFYIPNSDGKTIGTDSDSAYDDIYYNVSELTDYRWSSNVVVNVYTYFYDIDFNFIGYNQGTSTARTINTIQDTAYVRFSILNFGSTDYSVIDFQFEVGSISTAYEPYDELTPIVDGNEDLSTTLNNDLHYEYVNYINDLDSLTDYGSLSNLSLRQIFGDSLYGTGKTNLISNGDFSNGVTSWTTDGNNTLTNVGGVGVVNYIDGAIAFKQSINFIDTHKYHLKIGYYDSDLSDRGYYYTPLDGLDFINFSSIPLNDYSNTFVTDTTGLYTFTIGRAVYVDGTNASLDDVMLYDLTTLFDSGYEPNKDTFNGLINTYEDVTNNGEGVYELYTPDQRQDDYTYIKLIDVTDRHFEFNLTESFGVNIPSMSDFEENLIYDDVNDKYYYNVTVVDDSIVELDCEYNVENLVQNGDFSDGFVNWGRTGNSTEVTLVRDEIINEEYYSKWISNDGSSYWPKVYYRAFSNYNLGDTIYFGSNQEILDINNTQLTVKIYEKAIDLSSLYAKDIIGTYDLGVYNNSFYHIIKNDSVSSLEWQTFSSFNDINDYIEYKTNYLNIINVTKYYSKGNEPSKTEIESLIDFSNWSSTYNYNDSCYMTMNQTSGIYQYYEDIDMDFAKVEFTLTDTVYGIEEVEPEIVIKKYDINLNELGLLFEGTVSNESDINNDGFMEHNFSYNLPEPLETEEGYIYKVFNGDGGQLLTSGYVYNKTGVDFGGSLPPIRDREAIGINDTVYNDTDNTFLYNPETPLEYQLQDGEEIIFHYRFYENNYLKINLFNEVTGQQISFDMVDIFDLYTNSTFLEVIEGYFILKVGDSLPLLIDDMNNDSNLKLFNDKVNDSINYYNSYMKDVFNDELYADNYGVYTYNITDYAETTVYALGESPLYYMNSFNTIELNSHLARVGDPFIVTIYQYENYLGLVYDRQYLFDTNTLVSNFDLVVNGDEEQDIYVDIFKGLSSIEGDIKYNLENTTGVYRNGASSDSYDIYFIDTYDLKTPLTLTENRDNLLNNIGLNNTFGKVLFSVILISVITVFIYVKSRNTIATIIISVMTIGLLFILGLIEAWIILFIVIILFLLLWFMFGRAKV